MTPITVQKATQKGEPVDRGYGPMVTYALTLDANGQTVTADWFTKASTPPPSPGSVLEGTIEPSEYGPKFKKARNGFGGGGRPRDPQENARIMRQHSQEMALRYAHIRCLQEQLPTDFKLSDLKVIVDWFDADAKAAKP
jgi:hypothetical protein